MVWTCTWQCQKLREHGNKTTINLEKQVYSMNLTFYVLMQAN